MRFDREIVGLTIYHLRKDKFKSAAALSRAIGMSNAYINSVENGKIYPSLKNFIAILNALDVSVKDFDNQLKELQE